MTTAERYRAAREHAKSIQDPADRKACLAMCESWNYGYGSWPPESRRTQNMREIARIFYPKGD